MVPPGSLSTSDSSQLFPPHSLPKTSSAHGLPFPWYHPVILVMHPLDPPGSLLAFLAPFVLSLPLLAFFPFHSLTFFLFLAL